MRAHQMLPSALGALVWLALGAAPAFAQSECATDNDCDAGFVCEEVGGTACASPPPCEPDQECPPVDPCEPEVFYGCVPGPCASDADCGDGLICVSHSYEICTGEDAPCVSDMDCPEPEPPTCETVSESACAPPYVAPCEVDADCGEGFLCVEGESCACSSPGWDPDSGEPEPTPDDTTCSCEPTGQRFCDPIEMECTADGDCPDGWTCQEQGAQTCAAEPGSEPVCDTTDLPSLCAPPYWDSLGGGYGEDFGGGSITSGEANGAGSRDADDGGAPSAGVNGDGGCSVGGVPTGGAVWPLLALGFLARRRRRRR